MIAERVTDFTQLQVLDEAHVAYDHLGRDFLDVRLSSNELYISMLQLGGQ